MLVPSLTAMAFLTIGASAASAQTWLCVPETAGKAVTSGGTEGKCEAKNTAVELPPTAELTTLNKILPHITYVAEGIDKKPTIQFSSANVQIISGEKYEYHENGEGNLIIGYDEEPGTQTGSNNLMLGLRQSYTSVGGLIAGYGNTTSANFASVSGGGYNVASGEGSSISGGVYNTANILDASVSGGSNNTASGMRASVLGGYKNLAEGEWSAVYGGKEKTASKEYEVVG